MKKCCPILLGLVILLIFTGTVTSGTIKRTPDGGFVVGTFSTGNEGIQILKLSKDYSIEWQKVYGNEGANSLGGLAVHPDGGFLISALVSGRSRIFKIDPKGNLKNGIEKLNSAPTEVTGNITNTDPMNTSVTPEPAKMVISEASLEAIETNPPSIFLPDEQD